MIEPMSLRIIYAYIIELLEYTGVAGGDPDKLGYYAAILEGCFTATNCLTGASTSSNSNL